MKQLVLANVIVLISISGCSGTSEKCGAGTINLDGVCVPTDAGPGITCAAGTVLVGGQCVAVDAGPGLTCAAGTVLVGGQCVAVDAGPGVTCAAGTILVGGQCVAVDAGPGVACGAGTVLDGGVCIALDAGPGATIAVNVVGLGSGTIMGPGVVCTANVCSVTVAEGTPVELTAVPDTGYFFAGWRGGNCSTSALCEVTASGYTVLTAGFSAVTFYAYGNFPDGGTANGIYGVPLTGSPRTELIGPGVTWLNPGFTFSISNDGMVFAFNENASEGSNNSAVWVADFWDEQSRPVWPSPSTVDNAFPTGSLSPAGTSLAFYYNSDLYSMTTEGTDAVNVTNSGGTDSFETDDGHNGSVTLRFISWSPDGTRIAWVSNSSVAGDDAYYNVWVGQADGGNVTRLTDFDTTTLTADPGVAGIDWSPDGTKVAFVSSEDPTVPATGPANVTVSNLWTVDVTNGTLFCVTGFSEEYSLDMATYAPSENSLVFSSNENPALTPDGGVVSARNLFTVADDGTGLRALTTSTAQYAYSEGEYWAPDGKTLLFESNMDPADSTSTLQYETIWDVTLAEGATPTDLVSYVAGVWDISPLDDGD